MVCDRRSNAVRIRLPRKSERKKPRTVFFKDNLLSIRQDTTVRGYRETEYVQHTPEIPAILYRYCYYTVFPGQMQQKSVNSLCKIRFPERFSEIGLPISCSLTRFWQKSSSKTTEKSPRDKKSLRRSSTEARFSLCALCTAPGSAMHSHPAPHRRGGCHI